MTSVLNAVRAASLTDNPQSGVLEILWSDGSSQQFSHAFLRAQCQCAQCRTVLLKTQNVPAVAAAIRIKEIRPAGAYGVQLLFSDGHDRGIYPWSYLHGLVAE